MTFTSWAVAIAPPHGADGAAASDRGDQDAQLRVTVQDNRQPGFNRRWDGLIRRASAKPAG